MRYVRAREAPRRHEEVDRVHGSWVHRAGDDPRCPVCEQLTCALVELTAAEGFEAASAEALCARAGVSHEQFVAHVGSVQGCLVEAFQRGMDRLYARAETAFGDAPSWEAAFRDAIRALVGELAATPGLGRVLYVEAVERGGPEVWLRRDRVRQRFVELLAQEDDGQRLPPLRFELLVGALHMAIRQRVIDEHGWEDVERLADELSEVGPVFEPIAA
jgi:AcrR family transcriptional regulator